MECGTHREGEERNLWKVNKLDEGSRDGQKSLHQHDDFSILHAFQIAEAVFDIFKLSQLACPAAIRKLTGGVLRRLVIGKHRNLFETRFQILILAKSVSKSSKSLLKTGK